MKTLIQYPGPAFFSCSKFMICIYHIMRTNISPFLCCGIVKRQKKNEVKRCRGFWIENMSVLHLLWSKPRIPRFLEGPSSGGAARGEFASCHNISTWWGYKQSHFACSVLPLLIFRVWLQTHSGCFAVCSCSVLAHSPTLASVFKHFYVFLKLPMWVWSGSGKF